MTIIKDIRLYKSNTENIDSNSLPQDFTTKALNIRLHRIVMKLRESGFSLGGFDHLYLNFTTCLPSGKILPSKRSIDTYHPWYRYYDIGIDHIVYENLDAIEHETIILDGLRKTLIQYFSQHTTVQTINDCISSALQDGENMRVFLKEKKAAKTAARIYLRYLDNGMYAPLLEVYDLNDKEIFCVDLPHMKDLYSLGEVQLSSKKVTIKPRKNVIAKTRKPITHEW